MKTRTFVLAGLAFVICILGLIFLFGWITSRPTSKESPTSETRPYGATMEVHFIDVGQGGGAFIKKGNKHFLYDCGDTFAGPIVNKYLAALRVVEIDALVVSHAHEDHMAGCTYLLERNKLRVKRLYHNGSRARTDAWQNFLETASRTIPEINIVEHDIKEEGFEILVAYDNRGKRFSNEADNSVLLLLTDGAIRVLFTGDCERPCEKVVRSTSDVRADILEVGHHGSSASSSSEFLKAVAPKIAIIQTGKDNKFGHPTPEALARIEEIKPEIYRTDRDGTIVVYSDGKKTWVKKEK